MSIPGAVVAVEWNAVGSALVANAAAGATVLYLEDASPFDDVGTVEVDGQRLDFIACDEDDDTMTLAEPLASALDAETPVYVVAGGQVHMAVEAQVDHGGGMLGVIEIPFSERDRWPEGVYDDPVPVVLDDALTQIIDVPGRIPTIDGGMVDNPDLAAHLPADRSIPNDVWTKVTGWTVTERGALVPSLVQGDFYCETAGVYLVFCTARFAGNTAGARVVRPAWSHTGVDYNVGSEGREVGSGSGVGLTPFTMHRVRLNRGSVLWIEVLQNSGAALNLGGNDLGNLTTCTAIYRGAS